MLKLTIAILAFAVAGCAMPMWTLELQVPLQELLPVAGD
jgi:hypothetical protein